jgi:hypothetical protein
MLLAAILVVMVGAALLGVAVYFWPQIMTWAREHMLPWVERYIPQLADSVRMAFLQLDNIAVRLRRASRDAWRKLRTVLLSQTAKFVEKTKSEWIVQIESYLLTRQEADRPYVRVVTEQPVSYEDLPDSVRASGLKNGVDGMTIDIVKARDELLRETA